MGWTINSRVRKLERQQAKYSRHVDNADTYRFRLSCTCPPSTSIHFQGGLAWWPCYSYYPAGFFIPSYTVDLGDTTKTYGEFRFTNANWYIGALLVVDQDIWPPPEPPDTWPSTLPDNCLLIRRNSTEVETGTEAEEVVMGMIRNQADYYGICMGGIVFRNNGNTEDYNQFMPIDPINRGRSYLFDNHKGYGWEFA